MSSPNPSTVANTLDQRITAVGIRVVALAFLLHFGLLVSSDVHDRRQKVDAELRTMAEIVAVNSAAAVSFLDRRAAQEVLSSLAAKPEVLKSVILASDQTVLARYERVPLPPECQSAAAATAEAVFDLCGATVSAPVRLYEKQIGLVGVQISMRSTYADLIWLALRNLCLAVALTLLSVPVWRRLAKRISSPLVELMAAVDRVSLEEHRWVRVSLGGYSEVVALAARFNQMMDRLSLREDRLHAELDRRRKAEARLAELAYLDPVTGLSNRNYFRKAIDETLDRAVSDAERGALLCLDLDGFKAVNDSLGHDAGDSVLSEVGARLRRGLRSGDVVCRLGGDEFAVLLYPLHSSESADRVAQKLVEDLSKPYRCGQRIAPPVSVSIGITIFPDDTSEASALMRAADRALYQAKASGKRRYVRSTAELPKTRVQQLIDDLPQAIERGELFLVYQPKVTASQGQLPACRRTVGLEALLRWQHPRFGLVNPGDFIGIAESTGQIIEWGAWVLATACRDLQSWRATLGHELRVSVNLSPRQLAEPSAVEALVATLKGSGLPPGCVELELTESAFVDRSEASLSKLRMLRASGFALSVDDFGTGYSSLSYLSSFPLTGIKLDRSFVERIVEDRRSHAIAQAIVALAATLELEVVAEGIESEEQAILLTQIDPGMLLQGYRFAMPMDYQSVTSWLQGQSPEASGLRGNALDRPVCGDDACRTRRLPTGPGHSATTPDGQQSATGGSQQTDSAAPMAASADASGMG